jgi:hypothetical protein
MGCEFVRMNRSPIEIRTSPRCTRPAASDR